MDGTDVINEQNRFEPSKGVIPTLSPLDIAIDDTRLLRYIKNLEIEAKKHWNGQVSDGGANLEARRKQNLKYLFGRQLIGRDLKEYESEFLDNVVGESEGILTALAVSKMPDIVIEAGGTGSDPDRKLTAELLSKTEQKHIESDQNKFDLEMMFKHLPAYLVAVKKYRWDANLNGKGDIVEEVINPDHILLDHTALSSNPDEMLFVIHYVEKTAKEWAMLFPKKEEDIKKCVAAAHPSIAGDPNNEDVLMAQKVRVAECWYDWMDKAPDFDAESNPKFDFYSGVAWMLSDSVLLGKSKNPNWDYEGHDVTTLNGEPVDPAMLEQLMAQAAMTGMEVPGLEIKKVFNNYFKRPRKPFIFMTFEQFLRSAIDETSRIEQQIPLQKSMDVVERQTDHMVSNHKGKHIWSADAGITKKDLKKMDMNNPNVDALIKGDVDKGHAYIQPEMPPAEMFVHIRDRRDRMFSKAGAHGATRGEVTTQVATTNQISREADFTKNDHLVNKTILPVATESAKARLHMMKLRYTEKHFQELLGLDEGKYLHLRLTNDSIDDGLEVVVKASTTDKLRAERNSQMMASLGYSEPYYFMKDLNIPDAQGRAEAIFLWNSNPALWYEKVVLGKDISMLASQVVQSVQPTLPAQPQVLQPTGQMAQQAIEAPMMPTPTDTTQVATQPQGGQGSLLSRAGAALKGLFVQ